MADPAKEISFDKKIHEGSKRGAVFGDKKGAARVLVHPMPHDVLFDVDAAAALPAYIREDLVCQELGKLKVKAATPPTSDLPAQVLAELENQAEVFDGKNPKAKGVREAGK